MSPVGDDSFLHAGKIQFITDNFPIINWYPYWYLGFDIFESYQPTYYLLVGLAHVITGISIPNLIVIFLFLAKFLLGVSIYKFSKYLGSPWYISVGFALIFISLPTWTVTGGAQIRVFAQPFLIFSIVAVYLHVLKTNEKIDDWKTYFLAVFVLAFTVSMHWMYGFFAVIMTALIYLLAVSGIRQKIKTLLKVFIPVGGLVSWFYLSAFAFRIGGAGGYVASHEQILGSFESIFTSSNPILLPFALLLGGVFIFIYKKHRPILSREKISVLIVFLIHSLFFFPFGWFPMPEGAYFMAVYDYIFWFGFSLALLFITLSSLLCTSFRQDYSNKLRRIFPKNNHITSAKWNESFKLLLFTTSILMIFAAFTVSLPTTKVMNLNPDDPKSFVHGLSVAMGQIDDEVPNSFRLAAPSRRVYALQPYKYPQLELALGRQFGSPHAYYDSLFMERVFYRYHEDWIIPVYVEERARVHSEVPYMGTNFFSSMFWMDWFGVDGIVRARWDMLQTLDEYGLKPQYFNTLNFSGDVIYIQYDESSPILASTNTPTVGILEDEKNGEEVYKALFLTLGELNLNSQWVIPLKLERSDLEDNLRCVDTVLVTSDQYQSCQTLLEKYVHADGNLVIMDFEHDNSELKRAELVGSSLIFFTHAHPITPHEGSDVIAETKEGAVIYKSEVGTGSITYSSVTVQELYEDASPVASAILGAMLIPDFDITHVLPQSDTWQVSYRKNASGVVSHLDNEELLEYEVEKDDTYQITFQVFFENKESTSALGLIQFELWNDGKTKDLALTLISSENSYYLSYDLLDSSWTGWRTFSIPLASFIKKPDVSLLSAFNGIDFVITSQNQSLENGTHVLKIKNLGFYEAVSDFEYQPLEYEWAHPNQLQISIGENSNVRRLLWKGSYVEYWNVATNPEISGVKYYYAGPGVMFVYIPSNVEEIIFTMPLTETSIAGISLSLIFLALFIFVGVYKIHKSKRFKSE